MSFPGHFSVNSLRKTGQKRNSFQQPMLLNSGTTRAYFAMFIFEKSSYRHGVEEQAHKSHQESNDQELDQAHFVIIPQKVLQGLEWVHEPRERWIGTATRTS